MHFFRQIMPITLAGILLTTEIATGVATYRGLKNGYSKEEIETLFREKAPNEFREQMIGHEIGKESAQVLDYVTRPARNITYIIFDR